MGQIFHRMRTAIDEFALSGGSYLSEITSWGVCVFGRVGVVAPSSGMRCSNPPMLQHTRELDSGVLSCHMYSTR
jgi:hypothetical protein